MQDRAARSVADLTARGYSAGDIAELFTLTPGQLSQITGIGVG